MVRFSRASLSPSARFPASWAGDVSSLFKSGGFLYPCPSPGVREEEEGSRWGVVPPTYLLLKFFTCLFSCLCSEAWELVTSQRSGDVPCLCFQEYLGSFGLSFLLIFGLWQNARQGGVRCKWLKLGGFASNRKQGHQDGMGGVLGGVSGHSCRVAYVCTHRHSAGRLCTSKHVSYFKILLFYSRYS